MRSDHVKPFQFEMMQARVSNQVRPSPHRVAASEIVNSNIECPWAPTCLNEVNVVMLCMKNGPRIAVEKMKP